MEIDPDVFLISLALIALACVVVGCAGAFTFHMRRMIRDRGFF